MTVVPGMQAVSIHTHKVTKKQCIDLSAGIGQKLKSL